MSANSKSRKNNGLSSTTTTKKPDKKRWEKLVEEQVTANVLRGVTCHIYSHKSKNVAEGTKLCICGRLPRRHSFKGEPEIRFINDQTFDSYIHATEVPLSVYGELKSGAHFVRCDMETPNILETLCQLIVGDVGETNEPDLLICCYGGAEYFTMNDNLEKEFMNGIGQVATTKGVWVLTTGLNKGVSNVVGRSLYRHVLLNRQASKPTVIGLSSWGTVTERTRDVLTHKSSGHIPLEATFRTIGGQKPYTMLSENEGKTLDKHHSHFLLLDKGCLDYYLTDEPRSDFVTNMCEITKCYTMTIIVEGGFNTFGVILNDLNASRPVIIIQGSGRLADIVGTLLENTSSDKIPGVDEVKECLKNFPPLCSPKEHSEQEIINSITKILHPKFRRYLNVFQLESGASLTNVIFRAVLETQENPNPEKLKRLLKLAVSWNCIDGAHDLLKNHKNQRDYYSELFEHALQSNRAVFVDYFLRRDHDPLQTSLLIENKDKNTSWIKIELTKSDNTATVNANKFKAIPMENQSINEESSNEFTIADKVHAIYALNFIVNELYENNKDAPVEKKAIPNTSIGLDKTYAKLIGIYAESFYVERGTFERLQRDLTLLFPSKDINAVNKKHSNKVSPSENTQNKENLVDRLWLQFGIQKSYKRQEMLRDLFLWSVYMGYADTAFVLLLQIESRIGAALLAINMARHLSLIANTMDKRHKYKEQAKLYETYASRCIKDCHNFNEALACQLLLREIPLYGKITCMQIAISSRNKSFINTDTFDQVLNTQWYGQLDTNTNKSWWSRCKFLFSLLLFGVPAAILDYRPADVIDNPEEHGEDGTTSKDKPDRCARWEGIEDQPIEEATWYKKIELFHFSPTVKMFYHFLVYIWFLLVFSYMMLFHMASENNAIHWTEIYVFITVTAMLIEDIRKFVVEYHTLMLERWHLKNVWILSLYAMPYILFYIGFGLHMGTKGRADFFTAARIVLAIDLEIWYLFSLRFVSAIKLLGPKLFMIRNMMRDLMAFIYLIFVCIAAYGVVSRALFMYNQIEFTGQNIFVSVFYRPYWFLYSIVDDEKNDLDDIISSNTSTTNQVREATVTHVLLTFHMLFINILLLNLLIAVFNFSIQKVQEKNEYYWRYQRYELIKEYFEKPMFAFPPLSLIVYIGLLIQVYILRGTTCRVFKRRATPSWDKYWTDFENAATYGYTRTVVENNYRHTKKTMDSALPIISEEGSTQKTTEMPDAVSENKPQARRMTQTTNCEHNPTRKIFTVDLSQTNN